MRAWQWIAAAVFTVGYLIPHAILGWASLYSMVKRHVWYKRKRAEMLARRAHNSDIKQWRRR